MGYPPFVSGRMARGGAFAAATGGGGVTPFSNGYSVEFDGTDDNGSITADASLNTTGDVSFSAWVYADNLTSYKAIAAKRDGGGSDWQFAASSGKLDLYLPWGTTTAGSTTLSTGQWYHVAFTVDVLATDGIKLYVNGSAESNTGTASASGSNGSIGIKIGWNNVAGRYWNGKIDEVAWFHTALSASDITAIYNSGTPTDLTDYSPVGWWRMGDNDGGTGTTITDQGSGENDATLANGPTFSSEVPSA